MRPVMARRVLRGAVAAVLAGLPVALLALLVREKYGPLISFDDNAIRAATDVTRAHPGLLRTLLVVQEVMQPRYVYAVAFLVAFLVWRAGTWRTRAVWAAVTMLVGWNLAFLAKLVVQRARPVVSDPVSHAPGYSFPSGHAFNAAFALLMLLILTWPILRERSRALRLGLVAGASLVVVVTCLDRVFLGVHFPSDVVGGVILALAMAGASWAGYRGPRQVADQVADAVSNERS